MHGTQSSQDGDSQFSSHSLQAWTFVAIFCGDKGIEKLLKNS